MRATRSRKAKVATLARLLRGRTMHDLRTATAWLSGEMLQGRIGLGYAAAYASPDLPPAPAPTLLIEDVDAAFVGIRDASGKGSKALRTGLFEAVLGRATEAEQRFLRGLVTGELRQGALAGVMAEGIASAAGVPAAAVRRAAMLSGDLPTVAVAAFKGGEAGLAAFRITLFRPVQPMLAQTAATPVEALGRLEEGVFETKLDGARIQVHRDGDVVRVYTRKLREVTRAVPEVTALALRLPVRDVVLDGEVIALRPDGRPHPFQTTMRRFGRKLEHRVAKLREEVPLTPFFFDVLHADGEQLIDRPLAERHGFLERLVPPEHRVPRLVTADPEAAGAFLDGALEAGHEGVMAKAPDAPYVAGSRGWSWLKLKPAHTLDLVVLAADWGSGRRKGWLSNLHLGARDPAGGFVMLGKTFKGMTDELLAWQTEALQAIEDRRTEWTVHVRPELVVEIAFNEIQTSPRYPGGLALRFARVKGYRPDKAAADADTIATVRAIHAGERIPGRTS